MERLVRLLRVDSGVKRAAKNAEAVTKIGVSAKCAAPANNDTNMKSEMIKPSCRRMRDGWAPALEYDNGGVVIAAMRCGTMSQAISEAYEMLGCMSDYPDAFTHNHPAPNQIFMIPENMNEESEGGLLAVLKPVLDWYQSDEEDARPPLEVLRDIVADLQTDRAEVLALRAQIGKPPEGSHPHEQWPRSATWHEERRAWLIEVERLKAALSSANS